ncbi:MAG: hypothetical protein ACXVB4_09960 [Pseudobdellovibrionaceae bacterium]
MVALTLFVVLLFLNSLAFGETSDCLAKAPDFANILSDLTNQRPLDLISNLEPLCRELSDPEFQTKPANGGFLETMDFKSMEDIFHLQPKSWQKAYLESLEKLRKNPDNTMRLIEKTYKLAMVSFGEMNFQKLSKPPPMVKTLQAAFLAWSLSAVKAGHDFDIDMKSRQKRMWVRVTIKKKNSSSGFDFDLDPNLSGVSFHPLLPRYSGLSKTLLAEKEEECRTLKVCLLKRNLADEKSREKSQ